ncbi:MAG: CoA ester lyase, partial [Anaerolineaceae bacterium]|nr:CoA ester lyase [Anaerolineaceae bacterium]
GIGLIAIIETPGAIIHLSEICAATSRLSALVFGAEDMAVGLGATRTAASWEVFYPRAALVLHAAAFGLQAIDMVKIDFHDLEGLLEEARQGVELGFSGKQVIHPAQVAPVQQVFTPSDESIAAARELINTYSQHLEQGKAAFAIDGKMVDLPLLRAAENLLGRARAAGKID